jgi:Lar family restriction alleviation protein
MDKLKPCPHCGSGDHIRAIDNSSAEKWRCFIQCYECQARGPSRPTTAEACVAWNRRQSPMSALQPVSAEDLARNPGRYVLVG